MLFFNELSKFHHFPYLYGHIGQSRFYCSLVFCPDDALPCVTTLLVQYAEVLVFEFLCVPVGLVDQFLCSTQACFPR